MKRIKVVVIQEYNTPYRNGFFNAINNNHDVELHLVYIGQRTADRKWIDNLDAGFYEHQVKVNVRQVSYSVNQTKINYLHFLKVIREIGPQVIVSHLTMTTLMLLPLKLFRRIKFINWTEATRITENDRKINWKYRYFRNLFSFHVVPGREALDYLKYCGYKINGHNAVLMPNSVDGLFSTSENELQAKFSGGGTLKLLFTGNYIERKGFDILLKAFQKLIAEQNNLDIELHLAGAGYIEVPRHPRIIDHGFISKEGLLSLYRECQLFIMPSLFDCNPLAAIEAAKTGQVLLLSDGVGNHPELAHPELVFKRNNFDSLYEKLVFVSRLSRPDQFKLALHSLKASKDISHQASADSMLLAIKESINPRN